VAQDRAFADVGKMPDDSAVTDDASDATSADGSIRLGNGVLWLGLIPA
jgi:hypothetical protein